MDRPGNNIALSSQFRFTEIREMIPQYRRSSQHVDFVDLAIWEELEQSFIKESCIA